MQGKLNQINPQENKHQIMLKRWDFSTRIIFAKIWYTKFSSTLAKRNVGPLHRKNGTIKVRTWPIFLGLSQIETFFYALKFSENKPRLICSLWANAYFRMGLFLRKYGICLFTILGTKEHFHSFLSSSTLDSVFWYPWLIRSAFLETRVDIFCDLTAHCAIVKHDWRDFCSVKKFMPIHT